MDNLHPIDRENCKIISFNQLLSKIQTSSNKTTTITIDEGDDEWEQEDENSLFYFQVDIMELLPYPEAIILHTPMAWNVSPQDLILFVLGVDTTILRDLHVPVKTTDSTLKKVLVWFQNELDKCHPDWETLGRDICGILGHFITPQANKNIWVRRDNLIENRILRVFVQMTKSDMTTFLKTSPIPRIALDKDNFFIDKPKNFKTIINTLRKENKIYNHVFNFVPFIKNNPMAVFTNDNLFYRLHDDIKCVSRTCFNRQQLQQQQYYHCLPKIPANKTKLPSPQPPKNNLSPSNEKMAFHAPHETSPLTLATELPPYEKKMTEPAETSATELHLTFPSYEKEMTELHPLATMKSHPHPSSLSSSIYPPQVDVYIPPRSHFKVYVDSLCDADWRSLTTPNAMVSTGIVSSYLQYLALENIFAGTSYDTLVLPHEIYNMNADATILSQKNDHYRYILFPICDSTLLHYFLVLFDLKIHIVYLLESAIRIYKSEHQKIFSFVKNKIIPQLKDSSPWKYIIPKHIPQQKWGSGDCGIFIMLYAKYIIQKNRSLSELTTKTLRGFNNIADSRRRLEEELREAIGKFYSNS